MTTKLALLSETKTYNVNQNMIRSMKESDISSLSEIYYQTRLKTFDWMKPSELTQSDFLRDTIGETIWLAETNDCIVGFISVSEADNFIHHLYVLPNFAGQGFGTKLLQAGLSNIGRPARLKCVTENTKALNFYKSKDWVTVSLGNSEDGEYQLMEVR